MRICPDRSSRRASVLVFILLLSLLTSPVLLAQNHQAESPIERSQPATDISQDLFRLERIPVQGGAELITIKAKLDGIQSLEKDTWVPLVTVLRDTLGDSTPENDRLRYVWPLTYTRPTLRQRLSGAVPFL